MKNAMFYLATVLIWGSTWIGIKFQLGIVDPMVSVTYRFGLAAVLLLIWCRLLRLKMRFSLREHACIALQGMLLFGFNYLFFYIAELHITSGLAAVLFSTILVMNMVNSALLLRQPIDGRVVVGGILGLLGIVLVFRLEISSFTWGDRGLMGVALCLFATLLASLGNITSAYNQKKSLPIIQSNAYGMGYGALVMLVVAIVAGKSFTIDLSFSYVASLLYLVVFGSIIAFGCYLSLVGNIGADRAAYATLLFPIVALLISTVWEDYRWAWSSLSGVGLILLGNLWIMEKGKIPLFSRLMRRMRTVKYAPHS